MTRAPCPYCERADCVGDCPMDERYDNVSDAMNELAERRDVVFAARRLAESEPVDNTPVFPPNDGERFLPNDNQLAFMRTIALDGVLDNPRNSALHKLALLLGCTIEEIHTAQSVGLERLNAAV